MKYLIVVDMQNDFIFGELGSQDARDIVCSVMQEIYVSRLMGDKIIFTRDTHDENYLNTPEGKSLPIPHCIMHTLGWDIIYPITKEDLIINKNQFTYLDWNFNDDDEVSLVGVCTDICVISNALMIKALNPNVKVTIYRDCCAGTTPEKHKAALEIARSCQICVI